jgi:hypothetical protein
MGFNKNQKILGIEAPSNLKPFGITKASPLIA